MRPRRCFFAGPRDPRPIRAAWVGNSPTFRGSGDQGEHLVRAAVDVMGGDKAPAAILKGCWEAAPLLDGDDVIFLVGDETICKEGLASSGLSDEQKQRYRIV